MLFSRTPVATLLVFSFSMLPACAETIWGVTTDNRLISFDSASPGMLGSNLAISNLQPGEQVLGIDFRPNGRQLYAVGSSSRLYTLNTGTGAATQVGSVFNVPLMGTYFGVDFNPTVDLLRVVSDTGQNLRIGPDDAIVRTNISPTGDGMLAYRTGMMPDVNAGTPANVVAAAYTNNFLGATSTTLYDLDSSIDVLATQAPPNAGTLNTLGNLNINLLDNAGFDISFTSAAYVAAGNNLWTLNLTNAQATLVGSIGVGTDLTIRDISANPVPEPGTLALLGGALAGIGALRHFRNRQTRRA